MINLKVYDVISCLNKNLITHFVGYHEKEKKKKGMAKEKKKKGMAL